MTAKPQVTSLAEFLAARLDEDEAAAKATVAPHAWHPGISYGLHAADQEHIARHDPARALREVEAKRAILAQWEHSPSGSLVMTNALYQLAAVYSDHPDYRQEWAP